MSAEPCESCGIVADLITVDLRDGSEPFHVCTRCAGVHVPLQLPFEAT